MSLRSARLVLVLILGAAVGCGGGEGGGKRAASSPNEPKNAREKQLLEAKASGEVDLTGQPSWGKWRYSGERDNCFYVVGRRCFKTEKAACQAARCKKDQTCNSDGAGPATVACVKKK
jgi:hypothetical protein